ncbi:MAG: type VI secretion system baseplate subunit TssE [Pseudomonadota bacterium]|nr:type VI secretion system baseplate subunit TssE [Pseudomonadota bacterium]
MKGNVPGLLDRLMDPRQQAVGGVLPRMSVEQLKDSVARDLEALLNTRLVWPKEFFAGYPEAEKSILNYGLIDFAAYCLSSTDERTAICNSLVAAVAAHEPRLSGVKAELAVEPGSVNRLNFIIDGTLALDSGPEPIHFNAVLQPSSLHYAISRGARNPRT